MTYRIKVIFLMKFTRFVTRRVLLFGLTSITLAFLTIACFSFIIEGHVWEHLIVTLPSSVRILALSVEFLFSNTELVFFLRVLTRPLRRPLLVTLSRLALGCGNSAPTHSWSPRLLSIALCPFAMPSMGDRCSIFLVVLLATLSLQLPPTSNLERHGFVKPRMIILLM